MPSHVAQNYSTMRRKRVERSAKGEAASSDAGAMMQVFGAWRLCFPLVAIMFATAAGEAFLGNLALGWMGCDVSSSLFGERCFTLFPSIAVPAVVSMVFGARMAIAAGCTAALVDWFACGFAPWALICPFCGTLLAAVLAPSVRRAADFALLALRAFAAQTLLCLFALLVAVLRSSAGFEYLPQQLLAGFGVLLALDMLSLPVTLWMLLPIAERLSERTSRYTLATFANLEHPLLQRLSREAPGTYGHSMIVADIASAAAEAIGADSLLARIGGYFHDIGKLSNPRFFMENQTSLGNPHDALPPSMSVVIIASHVKDGTIIAEETHLPKPITRIIETHHGTSEMKWFLLKAETAAGKNGKDGGLADSGLFRYGGALPETREETIVSLADAIEAASRALTPTDAAALSRLVDGVVSARLADGQLARSRICLCELKTVKKSIVLTLVHRLHGRKAYPDQKTALVKPTSITNQK